MEISDEFFTSILKEKLSKTIETLKYVDDVLYYDGVCNHAEYRKDTDKYEELINELKIKYPELSDNLHQCWSSVRDSYLKLDELLKGIEKGGGCDDCE